MIDHLESYLKSLGVPDFHVKAEKLYRYAGDVALFSKTLSLVADKDIKSIIINHVMDSASAYPVFSEYLKEGTKVGDLGTGAGFPGVVLSVLFDTSKFFLIERMERRCGFLRGVLASLRIDNATLIDRDYESVDEEFDVITCRAFHPLRDIFPSTLKLLKPSGIGVFYKAKRESILEELEDLSSLGYSFEYSIEPLNIPLLDKQRNILVISGWRKDA